MSVSNCINKKGKAKIFYMILTSWKYEQSIIYIYSSINILKTHKKLESMKSQKIRSSIWISEEKEFWEIL